MSTAASVNEAMVRSGWALAIHGDGDAYVDAMRAAADDGVGIWGPAVAGCDAVDGDVVVLDAEPDPPGRDDENLDQEFVVIANAGVEPIDLGGWQVRDESTGNRFVFDERVLGPGDELVLVTGCGQDTDRAVFWCSESAGVVQRRRHRPGPGSRRCRRRASVPRMRPRSRSDAASMALSAALAAAAAVVLGGCGGDSLEVTDGLQAIERAELIPRDDADQLPEFVDGIATYGDPRWFIEFPAGAVCEGDDVRLEIDDGDEPDELVVTVRQSDVGDCDDAEDVRHVVLVMAEEYADARIVEVVVDE